MYQQLDDPVALPPSTREQRLATLIRGETLRRRRRAWGVAIPLGAAAVAAAVVGLFTLSGDPTHSTTPAPAASPTRSSAVLPLEKTDTPAVTAFGSCSDPVGDSAGDPDLTLVSGDRPAFPYIYYQWTGSSFPRIGSVEAIYWATSADGQRSRQLVVEIIDGKVVDQFVRDPLTGVRQTVLHDALTDTGEPAVSPPTADGLGASFPGAALSPLRDGFTWVAVIKVNGAVVDSCDGKGGSTMGR